MEYRARVQAESKARKQAIQKSGPTSACSICLRPQLEIKPATMLRLAFDSASIWEEVSAQGTESPAIHAVEVTKSVPTFLKDLVLAQASPVPGGWEFEPEDQKIVELVLASSLLHLNTTHWLRDSLHIDRIAILWCPPAQDPDPFAQWHPYITCSLEGSPGQGVDEDDDDVLSFGILVMEMEAGRRLVPTSEDMDWETGRPSKDSMLKQALVSWRKRLEDGYQQIGNACLNFRELVDTFYHPDLDMEMKRTAAIYKYILTPLYNIMAQRYRETSLLFKGFPQSTKIARASCLSQQQKQKRPAPLTLFDDTADSESVDVQ